jgi:hypothetical protein
LARLMVLPSDPVRPRSVPLGFGIRMSGAYGVGSGLFDGGEKLFFEPFDGTAGLFDFLFREDLFPELLHGTIRPVDEAAQVPGHARGLNRPEDDQEEKPYDEQFLGTISNIAGGRS